MGYVPQGRMIFPYLTVEENILAGMETVRGQAPSRSYIYDVFPVLRRDEATARAAICPAGSSSNSPSRARW